MPKRYIRVNLRNALKARGLDQRQLAEMTGLTTRTVSDLATDKMKRLPKDVLAAVADALNIDDISDLLEIAGDETAGLAGLSLRALNGVPVVLNAQQTAYHVPSFIAQLIDYGATMTNEEFADLIRSEPIEWRPLPECARLAPTPIAQIPGD